MKPLARLRALTAAATACAVLFFLLPAPAPAQVDLDLRDADLRSFVAIVSEATGRGYVLDPQVRGTVTVLAPAGLPPEALYEVFLNVLELNRLTIVRGRDADRIVPMSSARELAGGGAAAPDGSFETRVIEVRNAPLQEVIEVVRPLLPAEAVLTAIPRSRLLVLSDRGENFRRIERLIERLDQPRERPVSMIVLENAKAQDVFQVVQSLNIVPPEASVTVDTRSNALLVAGPDSLAEQIRVLAERLDFQDGGIASAVEQLRYADAIGLADVILRSFSGQQQVSGEVAQISIVPDPATNSLLITAPRDRIQNIVAMIRHLDRRPEQILVEAVIFEMSVEGFSDLSVQFGAVLNSAIVGGVEFSLQGRPTLTSVLSAVAGGDNVSSPGNGGTIGGAKQSGDDAFAGFLSAVASTNSTRLLATPSIMTLNNKEAEIVVAQNVPFVTGSYTTVGSTNNPENPFQTVERQNVGLTLNVTPQVNGDDTVRMVIKQEVSRLTNAEAASGGEITAKRSLTTTVLVRNGNVVMLGGLLEDGSDSVSQRVPTLSELPVLGGLFRGKNYRKNQRILLVLLRPRVVRSDDEAKRLADQAARDAQRATLAMRTPDGEQFPRTPSGVFPYDGSDLNLPFDAGFVDDVAQSRTFPTLPPRLRF